MLNPKEIERCVEKKFPTFGINKKREISRLIFEIAKREKISLIKLLSEIKDKNYKKVKKFLVEKRFPNFKKIDNLKLYLPELEINPRFQFHPPDKFIFSPKNIYIEENIKEKYLAKRLITLFPKAKVIKIDSLKNYLKNKKFDIGNYNRRSENVFVVEENYDFYKNCPCTKGAISCGYNILNLGLGCVYECVYCYLQLYLKNSPGIILPANIEDFFRRFPQDFYKSTIFKYPRLGNGEFSDSLALDNITNWSLELIDFFRKKRKIFFEFKTKSKNIDNLLKTKPEKNIVISWSLNPPTVIDSLEFYTASLDERIFSAKVCAEYGYKIGFHLDPIIYYKNWENEYRELINLIFKNVPKREIVWISLGTLRFNPELKKVIENRFPENKILDEELFLDFDNKLRYHPNLRIMIYKKIYSWLRKESKDIPIYLCMENRDVWRAIYGSKWN